ncbi:hypothetical protein P154DRAFT_436286 [Amniculicola lignicola CBS 123094]|uniref:AB hydrolase-1 domain-containing protein n=1 Tax=Amniculicola lignicola CBS 123094 TaxID=1392246 RepID=A0A6A5WHX0_9PLEO|nr:hypothetical protein P154DRAFT_436286 [Amniculicola lignicola CBS 123094]
MSSRDPRSSSTQSLVPDPASENTGRRTLLLVFIHGFMGNETSFRSFPAHLHNLVTITLAESHIVHTKIYPRYRSRYALEVARDEFSKWLTPHENWNTDVILLGHSMGGLLAADIALLFRHRIVGVINFDVPFLGMHPGIVKAGLGSIFKPWPEPQDQSFDSTAPVEGKRPSRINTLFNPKPSDPNFNPNFYNDVHLPVRKGWENTLHFINKHSNGLVQASKGLVKSHFEFGSQMADYRTLKQRYAKIRALEEDDEKTRRSANPETADPPRIRFVNYYTASTGRPKKPKSPKSPGTPTSPTPSRPSSRAMEHGNVASQASGSHVVVPQLLEPPVSESYASDSQSASDTEYDGPLKEVSPRISVDERRDDEIVPVTPQEPPSATSPVDRLASQTLSLDDSAGPYLPEVPPIPQEPPFVDLALYPEKHARKAAEKEHSQALKEYRRAVKARNAIINKRSDLEEKWEKQKRKEALKPATEHKQDEHAHQVGHIEQDLGAMQLGTQGHIQQPSNNGPYGNYDFSESNIMAQPHPDDRPSLVSSTAPSQSSSYADSTTTLTTVDTGASDAPPKEKKLKKFCMLPPKDANGNKDPAWVRVFMEGIDEVTAHTSLFFVSDAYELLVGDVGARIEEWMREAESVRVVRELEAMN